MDYDSEGETLTSKKVSRSGMYDVRNLRVPGVRMGKPASPSCSPALTFLTYHLSDGDPLPVPMKPPACNMHWQLLPYDRFRSKRLIRFDVALPLEDIRFEGESYRIKLSDADLDKLAVDGGLTKMQIDFESGPFEWEVHVKNSKGITCRDVFDAIYNTFNEQLTLYETKQIPRHQWQEVQTAFRLRCKVKPGLAEVEFRQGLKRVDVLQQGTIFLGLTQPKSGSDWILNLGKWPYGS